MLPFPSQNDNFFPDWPGALEKTALGDAEPTYFLVWPNSRILHSLC